jgi:hypothetical protein
MWLLGRNSGKIGRSKEKVIMPVHNWTRVPPGIFHHFHHEWISTICRSLNGGLLPDGYYALDEQTAAGFGPDILTLQATTDFGSSGAATAALVRPQTQYNAKSETEYYRRKKSSVVVRHVSDDRMVAVVEIISPGNKAGRKAFQALIDKACDLLENKVHLLFIDLFPPSGRDPDGLHAAIWDEIQQQDERTSEGRFVPPADKPLTLVAYEAGPIIQAHLEFVAVRSALPNMPLVLELEGAVQLPLETTYMNAYAAVPQRWRRVLETI